MSWNGCPGPFDLIQVVPYVVVAAVIVSIVSAIVIVWLTKREANKVFKELAYTDETTKGEK